METALENLRIALTEQVPNIVEALVILLIGFLIAFILRAVTRSIMQRLRIDERLNQRMDERPPFNLAEFVSQIVFWIVALFAIIGALAALELDVVIDPLSDLLTDFVGFVPNLVGAIILVLLAWIVATVVKRLITALFDATDWEDRLTRSARMERTVPLGESLGTFAYWLIWLLFLPAILSTLELGGLLRPVEVLVQDILRFVPNLLSAIIILIVGYFIARIVRDIVTNLLAAAGVDEFGARFGFRRERAGLTPEEAPEEQTGETGLARIQLSNLIGLIIYALILIPVAIAALDALNLEAISQPAISMLQAVLDAIPAIFAAGLLLALAYFVARFIADLATRILAGLGFDQFLTRFGVTRNRVPGDRSPSEVVGMLIVVAVMLFAAMEAASLLGFAALTALIAQFLVFLGNVILGLIVLGLGLYLANIADEAIRASNVRNDDLLATAARYAIILLAITMALRQMGIAEDIIMLAFGLLLGAIAVAVAIAFGLGGRDIAARELNNALSDLRERPQSPDTPQGPTDQI